MYISRTLSCRWLSRTTFRYTSATSSPKGEYHDRGTDLWSTFEYGAFATTKPETPEQLQSQKLLQEEAPPLADPIWNDLTDDDVKKGLELLKKYTSESRLKRFDEVIENRTKGIRFVFENPANVNNTWAALRTLDSVGIQYADIVMAEDRYYSVKRYKQMESALGSQKWMSLRQHNDTKSCLESLKADGYKIAVADLHPDASPISELQFSNQSTAVVIGNEKIGPSGTARDLADIHFYVPMVGFAESLNVSAFIAMLCGKFQSDGALDVTRNKQGIMSEQEKNRIYLMWLARSVSGAPAFLRRAGLMPRSKSTVWTKIAGYTTKP